jgi:hypothetical protein
VADLGTDQIILGYPFLKAFEPIIDWKQAKVKGVTTLSTNDAHLHLTQNYEPLLNGDPTYGWEDQLKEPGDEVWLKLIFEDEDHCRKTTIAQQLAEQATNKAE